VSYIINFVFNLNGKSEKIVKTCPNCGAKMEPEVNFCTSCGTDIRNVPLDNMQNPSTESLNNSGVEEPAVSEIPSADRRAYRAAQSSEQQTGQTFEKISEAVKNFDKESLGKWFITSWKTPSAEQQGEKWYGIAVLLLEMILFAWSMSAGIKKIVYSSIPINLPNFAQEKINSFIHSLGFDIFFLVLIMGAGVIAGSYIAHKFVYSESIDIFNYINKIVQLSNINVFVVAILAFFCFTSLKTATMPIVLLMILSSILYVIAAAFAIREDYAGNKDYFYGVILYLIIVAVSIAIAYMIFKGQLITQVQQAFNVDISKYFNFGITNQQI